MLLEMQNCKLKENVYKINKVRRICFYCTLGNELHQGA